MALKPAAQFLNKFPYELSGGQRQRVAIARALAVRPRVLLADEPVSMLDVSIRLGVLNLLADLRDREHLAILYVTHDIASARYLADTIVVMYAGQLVEAAPERRPDRPRGAPVHAALALRRARPRSGRGAANSRRAERRQACCAPPSGCRFHPALPLRDGDLQAPGPAELCRLVGPHRGVLASCRSRAKKRERERPVSTPGGPLGKDSIKR